MPSFSEQLRDYLTPRFELGEELGHGGMGVVYLARDTVLARAVAVKAITFQDAGAVAKARFLNEARRLAEVKHPNVVPIFEVAPEGCPFCYFIMEYLEGETLEQRLSRGHMPAQEVARLGRELLAALGAAHRRGVIHRDVKPSNIFLEDGRALLTDFGIAKSITADSSPLTKPDQIIGTEKYMAPEQWTGRAMPQSDFYALAIVLYESVTGDDWFRIRERERANWSKVPRSLRNALWRALATDPEDRWPDAAAFGRALWRRSWPLGRAAMVTAAALIVTLIGILGPDRGPQVDLLIARPVVELPVSRALGDSIAQSLAEHMSGFPDFTVAGPGGRWRSKITVACRVAGSGTAFAIRLDVPRKTPIVLSTTPAEWRSVIDPLIDSLLARVYSGTVLDSQLPRLVLPQSPTGMQAFLEAERAFARAWWDSAYLLYDRAADRDTTCVLCRLRHWEVGRFLSQPEDTGDESAYRARVNAFPPQYQALIRAQLVPLRARLDSLNRMNQRWPRFLSGRFRYADELIHRAPLVGRPRSEASQFFERTLDVRHDFAPAWEHLLWLWIAEGQAREAKADLDTLAVLAPRATTPVRDLLDGAFAWRFLPPQQAASLTAAILSPARARHEPLDAGARYLNAFDAQAGAIWLGAQLDSANDHRESAMLAQMFGYLGTGRLGQAHAMNSRVVELFGDPDVELFALELEATQQILDPDSGAAVHWEAQAARLREFARRAGMGLRQRAEWMAALLTQRAGRPAWPLERDTPAPLLALLNGERAAAAGDYAAALARTDGQLDVESENTGDPFFRAILHLRRADWEQQLGHSWSADRELIWYQNTDVIELPTGPPQPSEVDWALSALARWRRAGLQGFSSDRCRLYQDVIRLWAEGESRYAARVDTARRAVTTLRCAAASS